MMFIDKETKMYFNGRIKQVFVYLTNKCQLHCRHCLYKPLLSPSSEDIGFRTLLDILKHFKDFGAYKISFLGGEPTLYHDRSMNKVFADVVAEVRDIGYEYVRVDTNGQFENEFLDNAVIKRLDEITFSLDGCRMELNDTIRGQGSFKNCIENIKYAVGLGYNVQITSCVHKYTCPDEAVGIENVNEMILFAQGLGVKSINFHPVLKVGVMRDSWIDNTDIEPAVWFNVYKRIFQNVTDRKYMINVRIPMRFIEDVKYMQNPDKYSYCPLEMGERALIMPDGQIKVCAFTIGSPYRIANFNDDGIMYAEDANELLKIEESNPGVCCSQVKNGNLIPLCMSYKPKQIELIWNNERDGLKYARATG